EREVIAHDLALIGDLDRFSTATAGNGSFECDRVGINNLTVGDFLFVFSLGPGARERASAHFDFERNWCCSPSSLHLARPLAGWSGLGVDVSRHDECERKHENNFRLHAFPSLLKCK